MTFPELHWLPYSPDWNAALKHASLPQPSPARPDQGGPAQEMAVWAELVSLANTRIDSLGTIRLDRVLRQHFGARPPAGLATRPIRLAVLGSSTVDHLLPAIRVAGLRRDLWVQIYAAEYGQYATEIMDPGSALHEFRPDTVLFALDAPHLLGHSPVVDAAAAESAFKQVADNLQSYWRGARRAFGCKIVQQTMLPVFPRLFGNNEQRLPGSPARLVHRLNETLREMAEAEQIDLLSLDIQAAENGLTAWHDAALWHRAKQEVHPGATHVYGDLLGRLLAAHQGRACKCLVLDLDNTLWGGVVGDDGLDGLVLGQGSALGEAFVAFQRYARALSERGIILAVCSKNDEANALEPFERHPDMVLRRADIACFVANWTDKATNLREIARRLNIGLDALVFADDNPAERAIVRRELPMVAVPELPEDPTLFAACLADAGYFEGTHLTGDDLARTRQYQENLARENLKAAVTDLDGYLQSLAMEARWSRFDRLGLQRVVQLINKTNQFNLTTRRTTEDAILALIGDSRSLSLQIRLLDRFGDNGIVAIVSGRDAGGGALLLDTWLMSCRVLGRGMEQATLALVVHEARRLGAARLVGEYRPTAKNAMVRDHYASLGFTCVDEQADGVTLWTLELDSFVAAPTHIRLVHAE